ncbi:MAG: AMMECR1 domain-containing protein, partial [Thermodesulfobacteriota bacterium]|nr:AMMECR1 domain-containing protein [Thermodesulfobacteriota bacterium]
IHELDPENGVPEGVRALQGLPQTGLYITLMKGMEVRACVGRLTPYSYSMEKAIENLARAITFGDLRYRPLSPCEMEDLRIVLSFVGPMNEIMDPFTIDFTEEGLYIGQDGKSGVLLPGETRTLKYGIKRLKRQHGMDPQKTFRYASFKVIVFDERRDK